MKRPRPACHICVFAFSIPREHEEQLLGELAFEMNKPFLASRQKSRDLAKPGCVGPEICQFFVLCPEWSWLKTAIRFLHVRALCPSHWCFWLSPAIGQRGQSDRAVVFQRGGEIIHKRSRIAEIIHPLFENMEAYATILLQRLCTKARAASNSNRQPRGGSAMTTHGNSWWIM